MYTAQSVSVELEKIAPIASGIAGDELGFLYGDPARTIKGVACMWNVHTRSLEACIEQDLDMVICHESLWLPYQVSPWYAGPGEEEIYSNFLRRDLLDRHQIAVYRSHSNWDALLDHGVPDQAVGALGITGLREVARQKYFRVNELLEAIPVKALKKKVEFGLNFHAGRIFGDPDKLIRRFAFLIGGFGENQFLMPQAARELGAEALILGEMSEFIVISALEMGMPVIETLHSVSEIPALRRQADLLAARLPGLRVRYIHSGATAYS